MPVFRFRLTRPASNRLLWYCFLNWELAEIQPGTGVEGIAKGSKDELVDKIAVLNSWKKVPLSKQRLEECLSGGWWWDAGFQKIWGGPFRETAFLDW